MEPRQRYEGSGYPDGAEVVSGCRRFVGGVLKGYPTIRLRREIMALPKKNGIRTITVANRKFYWKVRVDYQIGKCLTIIPSDKQQAHIFANDFVGSITPDIVRQVIETALESGWHPDSATRAFIIDDAWTKFPTIRMDPNSS